MLSIASVASKYHTVHVFWDDPTLLAKAHERFDLDLPSVSLVPNIFAHESTLRKLVLTRNYDVLFFLTDGSIPMTFAKHNILHMQVPFAHIDMPFWKKMMYDLVLYNSKFTKASVDKKLLTMPSRIIYPPVSPIPVSKASRSKMILSVGRFGGLYNAKKFDILVDAFEKLISTTQFTSYTLSLAGGLLDTDVDAFEALKKRVGSLPITFYTNCSYSALQSLYEEATLYWHAAGYGEKIPEHMEHFGITAVEAMSAGAIPLVYNGGGLSEIVTDGENGYLWSTVDELVSKSEGILGNSKRCKEISTELPSHAVRFSKAVFDSSIDALLDDIEKGRHL